jgi:hypothetical protein
MAVQNFFPFSPSGATWESWNGNLIMFFGEEPIPYNNEINWKQTAANVAELPTFSVYPVPDPNRFASWQDWALEFTQIINGPSS